MGKRLPWLAPFMLLASLALAAPQRANFRPQPYDWPQWQGVERTAVSAEKGLLTRWPKGGPLLRWKAKGLGGGYSTPSVAAGRVFGLSYRGKDEVVWALDEEAGRPLWARRIATSRSVDYDGSRSTPTVDGNRVYALGVSGDLVCLEVESGRPVWQKNLVRDFGGSVPGWGYCESPLVDGEVVVATPGGKT